MKKLISMASAAVLSASLLAGCAANRAQSVVMADNSATADNSVTVGNSTMADNSITADSSAVADGSAVEALAGSKTQTAVPKYIFLFIGDGMSYPQIESTNYYLSALENGTSMGSVQEQTTGGEAWQEKALMLLRRIAGLETDKNENEFYVYEVLVLLTTLWLVMRKNILLPSRQSGQESRGRQIHLENTVRARMQQFLRCIEQRYPEDLTLEDIAQSASVSKSECLRCFQLTLQTTPYKYLMEYRLSKAAELLEKTEQPVSDISVCVGFHQVSYFGKCFKEKTGCSPPLTPHFPILF